MRFVASLLTVVAMLIFAHGTCVAKAPKGWVEIELDGQPFPTPRWQANGHSYGFAETLCIWKGGEYSKIYSPDNEPIAPVSFNTPTGLAVACMIGGRMVVQTTPKADKTFLVNGSEVVALTHEDGTPLKPRLTAAMGSTDCPYFVADKAIYRVKENVAAKVDFPEGVAYVLHTYVNSQLVVAFGKKYWVYENDKPVRLKDDQGNDFKDVTAVELRGIGAHLFVKFSETWRPYLLDGTTLKPVDIGSGSVRDIDEFDGRPIMTVESSSVGVPMGVDSTKAVKLEGFAGIENADWTFESQGKYAFAWTSGALYTYDGKGVSKVKLEDGWRFSTSTWGNDDLWRAFGALGAGYVLVRVDTDEKWKIQLVDAGGKVKTIFSHVPSDTVAVELQTDTALNGVFLLKNIDDQKNDRYSSEYYFYEFK
ncbi:MAG: hypothetical protein R3E76_12190 [Planctomycetota bacterium]